MNNKYRSSTKNTYSDGHLLVSKYWSKLFWICSRLASMPVILCTMVGSEQQARIAFGLLKMSAINLLKSALTCNKQRERRNGR